MAKVLHDQGRRLRHDRLVGVAPQMRLESPSTMLRRALSNHERKRFIQRFLKPMKSLLSLYFLASWYEVYPQQSNRSTTLAVFLNSDEG
jgi:hypothetical protein